MYTHLRDSLGRWSLADVKEVVIHYYEVRKTSVTTVLNKSTLDSL